MVNFNRVVLAGHITKDPEIRFTGQGVPVCSFGLAVNRVRSRDKDAVDFFDVNVWREQGEAVANWKRKGDPILIEGRLQYRTWEAQDGSRRSKVDVVADRVQFLGKGDASSGEDGQDFEDADEDPEPSPRRSATRGTRSDRGSRTG
jgi:single-strand DNA-binding protein